MSEIPYIEAEALRTRAERAEQQLQAWRRAARGLAVLAFIALVLAAGIARLSRGAVAGVTEARAANASLTTQLTQVQDQLQLAQRVIAAQEQAKAKALRSFEVCRAANQGLVEGIREQQLLLNEAIKHAKRCSI